MDTVSASDFAIKTEGFEGPLELLIELVEKRKLLINNISLAAVTDEYMSRVQAMQEQSLPHTAQFVALAATLLLIKSKSLLPALDLSSEEEATIEDLGERLKLYQIYRDIGLQIQKQFGQSVLYAAEYQPPREPLFVTDEFCSTTTLHEAMRSVITNLPQEKEPKQKVTVKPTISLEEMMDSLQKRIQRQFRFSFFDIKNEEPEHKTVIVGFLAILELFKQGDILVTQEGRYANIHVELEQQDIPRYY